MKRQKPMRAGALGPPTTRTWGPPSRALRLEPLESRELLAQLVSPNLVYYQDADGDQIQTYLSQPLLTTANANQVFKFSTGTVNGNTSTRQALETIDLTGLDPRSGLSIRVDVTRRSKLGDGAASVGLIDATGISLGTVRVSGDLGAIVAGNFDLRTRPIAAVVNEILARFDDNRDGQINFHTTDIAGVETIGEAQTDTFSRMDEDFNGRVTRVELANHLSRAVDTNSNGQLTTLELNGYIASDPESANILLARRGIDSLSVRSLGDTAKLPRSITSAVDEVFRRYDKNADTRIDLNPAAGELSAGQQVNTFSQMDANFDNRVTRPELATYLSRAVDNNSDNQLSTLELSSFYGRSPIAFGHLFGRLDEATNLLNQATSEIFRRFDANRDGLLDLNQFLSSREIASPEELNTFSSMDDDFDSKVSFNNLRQWLSDTVDIDKDDVLTLNERLALKLQDSSAYRALFDSRSSRIFGDVDRLEIRQHLSDERLTIDGTLRDAVIGGSILTGLSPLDVSENIQSLRVIGDIAGEIRTGRDLLVGTIGGSLSAQFVGDFAAGLIQVGRNLNSLVVGRDIVGGPGSRLNGAVVVKGALSNLTVCGDLIGYHDPLLSGSGDPSGYIEARTMGAVTIGRDVKSGAGSFTGIQAAETIGTLTIGRDIIGRADNQVTITAGGQPLTLARAAEDILKRYDKNKNGFVDLAQNIARREVVGEEQNNTFSRMDLDADNRISRTEIARYLGRAVDNNSNDQLTALELSYYESSAPEEFSALLGSGGPSTPLADIAAQILRRYDANRDNRIDLRQNIARREVTTDQQLNTFSAMDGDFDSRVTPAELRTYLDSTVDADFDGFLVPAEADLIQGQDPTAHSVLFAAPGIDLVPASGLTDVAIGRLIVGRDMIQTIIAAGYDISGTPINGDAQIGSITIGRDWLASTAVAGVQTTQPPFGSGQETVIPHNLPGIRSKIDQITIGRSLAGTYSSTDFIRITAHGSFALPRASPFSDTDLFGIIAQEITSLTIGGKKKPLTPGTANDNFLLAPDMRLFEVR